MSELMGMADATVDARLQGGDTAPASFTPRITSSAGQPVIRGYEIEAEIGRGGMGVVYLARQTGFERPVALKVLSGHEAVDLARFRMEIAAFASLEHANIVPVYEAGEDGGVHYFSMKHVTGGSLVQARARYQGRPRAIATLMTGIAAGVTHAHLRGILHRDLKPANILLDQGDVPMIADFGLAKRSGAGEDLTRSGQIVGTPGYMAPEQATGKIREQTTATDVYSLGAILYELLTGRPPFTGESLVDVLRQVAFDEPIAPSKLVPDVDGILEAIALKCLEKNPRDRYPSAGELLADLEAYGRGEDVSVVGGSAARFLRIFLRDSRHIEVMALWSLVWEVQALLTLVTFLGMSSLMYLGRPAGQCGSLMVPYIAGMVASTWWFRFRRDVPFSPVERQLAHIGATFTAGVCLVLLIARGEGLLFAQWAAFAVLIAGVSFHAMALVLGGSFYPLTLACFLIAPLFAAAPVAATAAIGVAGAIGLFIPARKFSPCRTKLAEVAAQCPRT